MTRADFIQRLQRERAHAAGVGETARVAELDAQIVHYSAGTPDNPAKETTGRRPAARRSTST